MGKTFAASLTKHCTRASGEKRGKSSIIRGLKTEKPERKKNKKGRHDWKNLNLSDNDNLNGSSLAGSQEAHIEGHESYSRLAARMALGNAGRAQGSGGAEGWGSRITVGKRKCLVRSGKNASSRKEGEEGKGSNLERKFSNGGGTRQKETEAQ